MYYRVRVYDGTRSITDDTIHETSDPAALRVRIMRAHPKCEVDIDECAADGAWPEIGVTELALARGKA